MKHQHARPRQQRGVELERRVFRGGADQHHGAVFHHGQKRILLRAVETMHLVDKQQRALAHLAPGARGVEHLLQIGDAGKHRGNLLEMQLGGIRQQPRHGGLAGAGRPPKHQRPQRARLQHPRQRAVGAQDVILADDIGQRLRASSIGQRTRRVLLHPRRGEEVGRLARLLGAHPPSVTLICWPPRTTTMRQSLAPAFEALSRSLVLAIFWLLTARMMSPFWNPTLAAVASSARSITTTPSVWESRCSSSAIAGEMLATLAPWNGERPVSTTSSRLLSGAVSSGTVNFTVLPERCTSICAEPPSGRVAKR